jgi:hypothetical protein
MLNTPYGPAELVQINFAYGVKARYEDGLTHWFAFWEVGWTENYPGKAC